MDRAARALGWRPFLRQARMERAWANRSGKMCRMLFVLIDGKFDPEIFKHFDQYVL
jgi:hypothetical protein